MGDYDYDDIGDDGDDLDLARDADGNPRARSSTTNFGSRRMPPSANARTTD